MLCPMKIPQKLKDMHVGDMCIVRLPMASVERMLAACALKGLHFEARREVGRVIVTRVKAPVP